MAQMAAQAHEQAADGQRALVPPVRALDRQRPCLAGWGHGEGARLHREHLARKICGWHPNHSSKVFLRTNEHVHDFALALINLVACLTVAPVVGTVKIILPGVLTSRLSS